ncbi:uncharacterized protein LOC132300107 isoform X2 [Cornus florida]|uniref:uncharacterized protein LOC132300107 isoform X2 n=1 Tax=Cornus florida TaxID=4283 RepID=UPI002897409C|nr:uncharacterized protein LOC132300107 isoform X2 [Cornus florida]
MISQVSRSLRNVQPADYIFKIESFSLLSETEFESYESNDFEAGGYKWRLSFYPNGNKKRNVEDHISFYLQIADTDNLLSPCWEVNVNFKLFVYDHIRDMYLSVEDAGQVRRFHWMRTENGFDRFLSLDTFKNASNGYLVDDCCVFGAEVFVIRNTGKGECLSMKKEPYYKTSYTWRVGDFLNRECLNSNVFKAKEWNWRLQLYPKGDETTDGQCVSLYLKVVDCETLPVNWKLYAKCKLRIKRYDNIYEKEVYCCFRASCDRWGFRNFMPSSTLEDSVTKLLGGNEITVEAEIEILSVIKNLT